MSYSDYQRLCVFRGGDILPTEAEDWSSLFTIGNADPQGRGLYVQDKAYGKTTYSCRLYGPTMGDEPVPEALVEYVALPGNNFLSRVIRAPVRPVNYVSYESWTEEGLTQQDIQNLSGRDASDIDEDWTIIGLVLFYGPWRPPERASRFPANLEPLSRWFWQAHALAI